MKKFSVLFLFIALFVCTSCNSGSGDEPKQTINRLTVQYYDEENLISQNIYTDDNFTLENYCKDDYEFAGWYLDDKFTNKFDESKLKEYFEMKVIALYAKMNKIMKKNNIEIMGLVNNKSVLNPAFIFENNNDDTKFEAKIYQGSTLVWNSEVSSEYVSVSSYLNADTEYTFSLTGLDSNYTDTISFVTGSFSKNDEDITVDNPFMSNMVIQRNEETIFSGSAGKNELVTVYDGNKHYFGISNNDGKYVVKVEAKEASFTPSTITISNGVGKEKALVNVLYGDVYLFAGQSNMQWPTMNSDFIYDDVSRAKLGNVRYFSQDVVTSTSKLESVKNGKWFIADSNNINYFSAIAFMGGSMLSNALKNEVPIGIMTACQGDTNIVNWMGSEYYSGNISTKYLHYNAMVYPLRHTKLSGVVWYQGCNNSASGGDYKDLLLKLFQNYRELFNSPNTPFFVIGLCCYDGDSGNNYDFSYVRESQALACSEDENAYFISTCDNGDPTFIHPKVKRYICERVSKSIQSVVYGKDYLAEGPIYKSHTVNGNTVTIEFYNAEGLMATGDINGMYLAGKDGKYYPATASIQNSTIVASSEYVENPVYIKYGFGKSPFVNVFNKDNFAITPFRTDDHNNNIDLLNYESLDNYYFHPDGSNMSIAYENGNLKITKANDGKTYGSVRLDVWGMIAYLPEGFRFTLLGTNSNASISFRIIEGSYEIWAYKVVDNFTGEKTFEISSGEFSVVYNKEDGILNTQKVIYLEIMVEAPNEASFAVKEARFINIEKTAPQPFSISSVQETETSVVVAATTSIFAESYNLKITSDAAGSTPIFEQSEDEPNFSVDKSLFNVSTPYYVFVTALNELGSTASSSNGMTFYLKSDESVVVCNFDFQNQAALDAYIASSMDINAGLTVTLETDGVKITSSGAGWQQFIFKLESGVAEGMTKLQFDADFTNYNGTVVLQLADTSWNVYQCNLSLDMQNPGTYTVDFSSFLASGVPFTTQNLMWVMFNFSDNVGNGYILFDDCILTK